MENIESDSQSSYHSNHNLNQPKYLKDPSFNINDMKYEILPENNINCDVTFKIIIVGNAGVGKSCLSLKATKNIFYSDYNRTIGFEFFNFNICFEEKERINLHIWDTCGQEVYRSFISNFFRNSSLAIIVYSIDDKKSFDDIEEWIKDIKISSNPDTKLFLLGNKADLENMREVKYEEGEQMKKIYHFSYFNETSAKTGLNVTEVFVQAAKLLYKEYLGYKNKIKKPLPKNDDNNSSKIILSKKIIKKENKNVNNCRC